MIRILVVDDERDVEQLFIQRFRKEIRDGLIEFHFSFSGEDALDTISGREFGDIVLILSDINMPGMNGLDLLIFTAGVGENDFNVRKMICTGMEFFGIDFDPEVNHGVKGKDLVISKPGSKVTVMVVTTDEEFVIASDTKSIVEKLIN